MNPEVFPAELRNRRQWIAWKLTIDPTTGKVGKFPVNPRTGRAASSADPNTWDTFESALDIARLPGHALGFALTRDTNLAILDLENCVTENGDIEQWAAQLVAQLNSFTEVSVSGRGLHILMWGSVTTNRNRQKVRTELWGHDKMFALTGDVVASRDRISNVGPHVLQSLEDRIERGAIGPDAAEIAARPQKYLDTVSGNWQAHYGDRSSAVHAALCTLVGYHGDNADAIRAEFEATPLCQQWTDGNGASKWARLGAREIQRATDFVLSQPEPTKAPVDATPGTFERTEGGFAQTFEHDGARVTLTASSLRWDARSLHGYLELSLPGREARYREATFTAPNSVHALARGLTGDWTGVFDEFSSRVVNAMRGGREIKSTDLATSEVMDMEEMAMRVDPAPPLLREGINIWFGDGEAGKSLFALYAAGRLAQGGMRVGYFDWELEAKAHATRYQGLFPQGAPPVLHYRFTSPMARIVEDIREIIRRDKLDFAIFDSAGYASVEPESSDAANQYIQAASTLGIGSLHLAHSTKNGAQKKEKPFGSAFWFNGGRLIYYIERHKKDNDHGVPMHAARFLRRKNSFGAAAPVVANARVLFAAPWRVDSWGPGPEERILELLRRQPMTQTELAAELDDVKTAAFRTAIKKLKTSGEIVQNDEKKLELSDRAAGMEDGDD